MQVIAPDFFAGAAAGSTSREAERPGNGRFEALLRDEDQRYRRDNRDLPRPAADDLGRKEPPREKPLHNTRPREERVERHERPAGPPASDRPDAARRPQDDARPAPSGDATAAPSDPAAAQTVTAPKPATAPAAAEPAQAPASLPATPSTAATAPDAAATPAAPAAFTAAVATEAAGKPAQPGTLPPAIAKAPEQQSQPATQPVAEAAAATPETTAQPASGAAAALRAADKAAPQATAKAPNPVAAAHRQSPLDGPPAGADRPQAGDAGAPAKGAAQTTGQVVVATTAGSTLESRPAAATLGGAAATVALAQDGDAQNPNAKAEPAATLGQQNPAGKPSAQAGQAAATVDLPTTAAAKAATERAPGAPPITFSGGDPAATSGTPVTTAAGLAQGAGGVQGNSFAATLASARPSAAANPAEQIAIQVQRAQVAGQERISIKLHPAELGRIEVRLENASDGTLRAVISAERSETLDLLQRDARGLERALQEAGVKTDSGSLNFNLRGNGQGQGQQAEGNGGGGRSGAGDGQRGSDGADAMPDPTQPQAFSHDGTLDIRV
jgi:flagellar hook-length control protein FliK